MKAGRQLGALTPAGGQITNTLPILPGGTMHSLPYTRVALIVPACVLCGDEAAAWEAMTRWGALANLCDGCADIAGAEWGAPILDAAAEAEPLTLAEVTAYLGAQTWVFAKTMPKWPHEYVLARRSTDLWMHLRAVAYIRAHGESRYFAPSRRYHSYLVIGDHEYWTMRPFDSILNRKEAGQ